MKRGIIYIVALLWAFSLVSCRSTKDIMYLSDMGDNQMHQGLPAEAPEYHIQPNDNLYVDIKSMNPEVAQLFNLQGATGASVGTTQMYGQLSGQYLNGYQVDMEGNIKLPIMGKINVAGLTPHEAEKMVQKKTAEYIKDANVKVKLLSYRVTVMGEVKNPGVYYNYNNSLTVLEAVSMASDITDFASIKQVLVVRPTSEGSRSYRLDFTNKNFMASEAFYMQPNDVVYVEPDKHKNVMLNSTSYSLFLSSLSALLAVLAVVTNL